MKSKRLILPLFLVLLPIIALAVGGYIIHGQGVATNGSQDLAFAMKVTVTNTKTSGTFAATASNAATGATDYKIQMNKVTSASVSGNSGSFSGPGVITFGGATLFGTVFVDVVDNSLNGAGDEIHVSFQSGGFTVADFEGTVESGNIAIAQILN